MKRADSLLAHLIRDLGLQEGVALARMKKEWHVLFQKPLVHHITPAHLSEGELLLYVDSPVWLQELNFFKHEIVRKLNSYGVREVRFRLGRNPGNERSTARQGRSVRVRKHLHESEQEFVDSSVSDIHDASLKAAVKVAMQKAIASGRTKIS
ncbi:MAG: DUF721 domain-containing protein [Nitrospirota bacterium]